MAHQLERAVSDTPEDRLDPFWFQLGTLIVFAFFYQFLVSSTFAEQATLSKDVSASISTSDLAVMAETVPLLLLRIACLLIIPLTAIPVSKKTISASLICFVLSFVVWKKGLSVQPIYFIFIGLACVLVRLMSMDLSKSFGNPEAWWKKRTTYPNGYDTNVVERFVMTAICLLGLSFLGFCLYFFMTEILLHSVRH